MTYPRINVFRLVVTQSATRYLFSLLLIEQMTIHLTGRSAQF